MEQPVTLVRHSGFGYGGHPQFQQAVETCWLDNATQMRKVLDAGGIIFSNPKAAMDAEEEVNYPPHVKGLIPHADGTFSTKKIDKLQIYLPTDEERERYDQ